MEGWACQFIKQLCTENQLERDASNSRTHSCWLRKRKVHVRQGCGNLFWVFLPDIRWDCPEIHPRLGFPITFPKFQFIQKGRFSRGVSRSSNALPLSCPGFCLPSCLPTSSAILSPVASLPGSQALLCWALYWMSLHGDW